MQELIEHIANKENRSPQDPKYQKMLKLGSEIQKLILEYHLQPVVRKTYRLFICFFIRYEHHIIDQHFSFRFPMK